MQKRTRDLHRVRRRPASVSRTAAGLSASAWAETARLRLSSAARVGLRRGGGIGDAVVRACARACRWAGRPLDQRSRREADDDDGELSLEAEARERGHLGRVVQHDRDNGRVIVTEHLHSQACNPSQPASSFVLSARGRLALLMRNAGPISTERLAQPLAVEAHQNASEAMPFRRSVKAVTMKPLRRDRCGTVSSPVRLGTLLEAASAGTLSIAETSLSIA